MLHALTGWLLLIAVAGAGAGGLAGFGLLLAAAFRCDESCDHYSGHPGSWRVDEQSWVWNVLGWGGLVLLGLTVATLVLLCVRPWRRWTWVPPAAIAALVPIAMLTSYDQGFVDTLPLAALAGVIGGLAVYWGARLTRAVTGATAAVP